MNLPRLGDWIRRVSARGRASGSGPRQCPAATLPTPVLSGPLVRATGALYTNTRTWGRDRVIEY